MAKIEAISTRRNSNISLPENLIDALDKLAERYGSNRSRVAETLMKQDLEIRELLGGTPDAEGE